MLKGYSKLPLDRNECVNVLYVCILALQWTYVQGVFLSHAQCFLDKLCIHRDPDQVITKAVTESK